MEPDTTYANKRKEANDRERLRMKHLNDCFNLLRESFSWLLNVRERVRSKVQVLKDCLVYIRELEKRVDPQVLRELQENFHIFLEQADRKNSDEMELDKNCKQLEPSSGIQCHDNNNMDYSPGISDQDQCYSRKRRRVIKTSTTCEYAVERVEYYTNYTNNPYSQGGYYQPGVDPHYPPLQYPIPKM